MAPPMRRFEAKDSERFWEITREEGSNSFFIRHGKLGTDGRAMPAHHFSSTEALEREMERRIAGTLKKGYVEVTDAPPEGVRDPQLEEQLRDAPSDEALWEQLLAKQRAGGDPRAELAEAEDEDARRKVLRKHPLLPAALVPHLRKKPRADRAPSGYTSVQWRHGFIESALLGRNSDRPPVTLREMTEGLLRHPSARFLRELIIGALGPYDEYDYGEVVSAIARVGSPSLRRLVLADFATEHCALNWSKLGAVRELAPALPRLRELVLRAGRIDLDGFHMPQLRGMSVTIITDGGLEALAANPWPELTSLVLHAADQALSGEALLRLLRQAPSLQSLTLAHTVDSADLLNALVHSEILQELDRFVMEEGTLVDTELHAVLSELPPDLEIALPGHALSPEIIAAAGEEGLTLSAPDQRVVRAGQTIVTDAMVRDFAPDSRSLASAKKIASPQHWPKRGRKGDLLWGHCQGGDLYEVFVTADHLDSGCTCPSPKFPCKHSIALLMMAAGGLPLADEAPPDGLVERCGAIPGE